MNVNKFLLVSLILFTVVLAPIGAQDFGFEDFGFSETFTDTEENSALSFSGEFDFSSRFFINTDNPETGFVETPSSILARIESSSPASEFTLALRLSPEIVANKPIRIIDEATLRTYWGDTVELTVGMTKVVWGKGDSLRLLDVVNPHDYSDPFNTDIEGRKIAQALIKVDWRTGMVSKLEAVYVPFFQGDYLPLEGIWAPKAFTDMRAEIWDGFYSGAYNTNHAILIAAGIADPAAATIAASQSSAQADTLMDQLLLYPDTKSLEWGQGGLRYTDSFKGVDIGMQYYTGFLRTPAINADPAVLAATQHLVLSYNRYHQIGVDSAFALGPYNIRAEAAWHQTYDPKGTDPLIRNPFASMVLGVDRAFGAVSLNLQALGTWITNLDQVNNVYDIESTSHKLSGTVMGQLGYTMKNGKMEVTLAGAAAIPDLNWMLVPGFTITPVDDVTLSLNGYFFGGDSNGQFGQYHARKFLEFKAAYAF
ncbi:MAG: hypothetical protein CVV48_05530 [Spirochaetae bacterium HGW-Spirochaetae-4]|nr:MAG: hypothetical protein CVV48_05530 [Spirochaetae bacterium HGW-Spirochaetae-4]